MKKRRLDNIKALLILLPVIILTGMINPLPWWAFLIPVLLLGMTGNVLNWNISSLSIGFLSGFVAWFGANLYFDTIFSGVVLGKIAHLLSVPEIVILLLSGLVGGLLTALALYTGKSILREKKPKGTAEA